MLPQHVYDLALSYAPVLIFFFILSGLAVALVVLPFLFARMKGGKDKLDRYECGFEAFEGRGVARFDVHFYLVSILFIVFDLEIAFLFPWAVGLHEIGEFGFCSMMIFLFVLTVGFIYEWRKGALNW